MARVDIKKVPDARKSKLPSFIRRNSLVQPYQESGS